MEKTGRVGVGSFVMRGHEYLVAIVSDNGVLRADTLRYTDEIRTPESIGLPKVKKPAAGKVTQFGKAIDELKQTKLDMSELADQDARGAAGAGGKQTEERRGRDSSARAGGSGRGSDGRQRADHRPHGSAA